jgi:hypothetical protein
MPTMDQILADTKAFVQQKQASFGKDAAEQALSNPGSIPGSEHDDKADPSMQNSHPETQEEIPPGTKTRDGATDGEDVESGHASDATEPIKGVDKKPLESDDAMGGGVGSSTVSDQASSGSRNAIGGSSRSGQTGAAPHPAAKHANDLLSMIHGYQTEKQAEGAPAAEAAPAADTKSGEHTEGAAKDEKCEECGKTGCDCKKEDGDMKYSADQIEITQDVLSKIASVILSTEEGWEFAEKAISKAAGAQAARETIDFLTKQAEDAEKQAAYGQGAADADALIKAAYVELGRQQALAEVQPQQKQAHAAQLEHGFNTAINRVREKRAAAQQGVGNYDALVQLGRVFADQSVKLAQDYAAAEEGAEMGGEMGAGEMGPAGAEEAMGEMAAAPEGDVSPEELQQALALLVEEGQIDPAAAEEIMSYVSDASAMGGEAGGEVAADPAAMMGAEADAGAGADAAEDEGMETYASASDANTLLAAIRRVKAHNAKQ